MYRSPSFPLDEDSKIVEYLHSLNAKFFKLGCVDNPFYVRYFYASYGEDRFFYYPPCIRNAEDFEDFLQEIALTDNCFYVQT